MKFLVIWKLELSLVPRGALDAVLRMPDYAAPLERSGKIYARFHVVGSHGGAWIYDVDSNEELERLLAIAPVYNLAHYEIYPLAEMGKPPAACNQLAGRMHFSLRPGLRVGTRVPRPPSR